MREFHLIRINFFIMMNLEEIWIVFNSSHKKITSRHNKLISNSKIRILIKKIPENRQTALHKRNKVASHEDIVNLQP